MEKITVYYRPSCAFSLGVLAFLALRGADFELVNLDLHADAEKRLERALEGKKLETPTLEVRGREFVAPSMSRLKELLELWGLSPEAAPHERLK